MAGENGISTSTPVALRSRISRIFLGSHGLRGGWRVLIFLTLLVGIVLCCIRVVRAVGVHHPSEVISPGISLVGEILLFPSLMIVTAVMGRFERRSFGPMSAPRWRVSQKVCLWSNLGRSTPDRTVAGFARSRCFGLRWPRVTNQCLAALRGAVDAGVHTHGHLRGIRGSRIPAVHVDTFGWFLAGGSYHLAHFGCRSCREFR